MAKQVRSHIFTAKQRDNLNALTEKYLGVGSPNVTTPYAGRGVGAMWIKTTAVEILEGNIVHTVDVYTAAINGTKTKEGAKARNANPGAIVHNGTWARASREYVDDEWVYVFDAPSNALDAIILSATPNESDEKQHVYNWQEARPSEGDGWPWEAVSDGQTGTARNMAEVASEGDAPAASTRKVPEGTPVSIMLKRAVDDVVAAWFNTTAACCDEGCFVWVQFTVDIDCEDYTSSSMAVAQVVCGRIDRFSTEWTCEDADPPTKMTKWVRTPDICPDDCDCDQTDCSSYYTVPDNLWPDYPTAAQVEACCGGYSDSHCFAKYSVYRNCETGETTAVLGPLAYRCAAAGTYAAGWFCDGELPDGRKVVSYWVDGGQKNCQGNDDCGTLYSGSAPADPADGVVQACCEEPQCPTKCTCTGTAYNLTPRVDAFEIENFNGGATFPAGCYCIKVTGGAINYDNTGMGADPWYLGGHNVYSAGVLVPFPGTTFFSDTLLAAGGYASEAAALAATKPSVIFRHAGGTIGLGLVDSPYEDNEGSTTYQLCRIE